jgi:hypothetical protein
MKFVSPAKSASLPLTNIKSISLAKPSAVVDSTAGATTCTVETLTEFPPNRRAMDMSVGVIQSNNAAITRVLRLLGEDILQYVGPANNWRGNKAFDEMLIDGGVSQLTDLAIFKKDNMHIMSSGIYENVDRKLLQNNKIPHKFVFPLATKSPPHLTYFSFCFLDNPQIQQPKAMVKNDTAFENRTASSTLYFYQMPDGNYWSGPVNKQGNTYVAQDQKMTKLTTKRTTNAKILDFRVSENLAEIEVMQDFENEKKKVKDRKKRPEIRKLDPATSSPHPYVSDIFPAYDPSRNVRFSFMVNFEDLVFDNSEFGNLWRTQYEDLKKALLKSSKIEKIKIWRQRVKRVPNQAGFVDEKNFVPVLIADSGQRGTQATVQSDGSIREQENVAAPENMRTFDVTDNTINNTSKSCYRYWAEIKVRDGTKDFFREKVKLLRLFYATLKDYVTEISKNKIEPVTLGMEQTKKTEGYNPVYDSLTDNFADDMREKYWKKITKGKADYLKIISLFSAPNEAPSALEANNFLINLLDPNTTSLDNISSASKMVHDLIIKITSVVSDLSSTSSTGPSNTAGSASSKIQQTVVIKNFKTLVDFKMHNLGGYEYIVGGDPAQDFDQTLGLKQYSGQAFLNRLQKETLKYYVNSTPKMDLGKAAKNKNSSKSTSKKSQTIPPQGNSYKTNLYSYLSPSRVTYGNPKASFTSIDVSQEQSEVTLRLVENKLKANRISFEKTGFTLAEDDRFTKLIQDLQSDNPRYATDYVQSFILESIGITEIGPSFSSAIKKISCDIENSDDIERRDDFSLEKPNDQSSAGVMPASLAQFVAKDKGSKGNKYVNYGKKRTSKNAVAKMRQSDIEALPNQLAAFFLTNSDDPQDVRLTNNSEIDILNDSRYSSTSLFNYRLIVEIEYLADFDKSTDGITMMTSPRWLKLTPESYASLSGKSVLCRLVKHTNSQATNDLNSWPEEIDMRIYNEYFFLKPQSAAGAATSQPAPIRRKITFPETAIPNNPFRRNIESGTVSLDKVIPPIRQRVAIVKLSELEKMKSKLKDPMRKSQKEVKDEYQFVISSLKDKANRGILTKSDVVRLDKFKSMLSKEPTEIRNFVNTKKSLEEVAKEDTPNTIIEENREAQASPTQNMQIVEVKPVQKKKKSSTRRIRKRTREE